MILSRFYDAVSNASFWDYWQNDISFKMTTLKTDWMKCQILFSGKNKKNISICYLLEILPRVLSLNLHSGGDVFPFTGPLQLTSWSEGQRTILTSFLPVMLMLSTLCNVFNRQHFYIIFLFFRENRFWHFMQIVSIGDNLHEISNPVFLKN